MSNYLNFRFEILKILKYREYFPANKIIRCGSFRIPKTSKLNILAFRNHVLNADLFNLYVLRFKINQTEDFKIQEFRTCRLTFSMWKLQDPKTYKIETLASRNHAPEC